MDTLSDDEARALRDALEDEYHARRPDVRGEFQRLKEASEERHLHAFRRCVERMGRRHGR